MSDKDVPVQMGLIDGPGTILRRAREEKGLDIAAVAAMLHLSEFKVKAIEADDFNSLPEPVFVRGYLKNYARILEEEVDPVLNAYTNFSSEPDIPEQKLVDSDSKIIEISNNPDLVKIVTIAVVAILILIPVIWWWSDLEQIAQEIVGDKGAAQSELPVLSSEPESEKEKEIGVSGTIPLELSEIGDNNKPVEEEVADEDRIQVTIDPKPDTSPIMELELPESQIKPIAIPQQPVVEEVKPEPKPIPKPEPKPKPVVTKPVSTSVSKPIPLPVPKPTPKPAVVEQGVWLKFVESGWVKVRDARNRVILIGDHNKGAIKKLGSESPYKVVLGNSKAVRVEINGKVVDIERFSSGGVARFTIDNGKVGKP